MTSAARGAQPAWLRVAARWALATAFVAVLVVAMVHLSRWQWNKHVARDGQISTQQRNLAAAVAPVGEVLRGDAVTAAEQWRPVRLVGTYDTPHQLVVVLRTVGGVGGSEVLTPLRLPGGGALLVDRGFYPLPADAAPGSPGQAPPPPGGTVTVTGYLRVAESRSRPPTRDAGQVVITAIDPRAVAAAVPYPVTAGYVSLTSSTPAQAGGLQALTPPTYDSGPYLAYSVQWIIFCVIAAGGLVVLAVDEFGGGRLRDRLRRDDAPGQPAAVAAPPTPLAGVSREDARPAAGAPCTPRPVEVAAVASGVLAGAARGSAPPADYYDDPDDPEPPPDRHRSAHDEPS